MKNLTTLACFICYLFSSNLSNAQTNRASNIPVMHNGLIENFSNASSYAKAARSRIGNGNSSLGQSFILQNVCGLDYVTASQLVETRTYPTDSGTGLPTFVTVSGLPSSDSILKALLYWGTSYTSGPANPAIVTITNPASINFTDSAAIIGTGPAVCWGEVGTAAYRADVTNCISGNGTYNINLSGAGNSASEVDGVSLIIIYSQAHATFTGNLSLWDGDLASPTGSPLSYTFTGFNVCSATSTADAFALLPDMQSNVYPTNTENFNGSTSVFSNDMWNYEQVPTRLVSGQTTTTFNTYTNNSSDCYWWILAGLYWQDTVCSSCCPVNLTVTPSNPTICRGGSVGLNATGNTSGYHWTPSTGLSCDSCANPIASPTVTTTYQVHSDSGCNLGNVTVFVKSPPSASVVTSPDSNLCNGIAWAAISSGTPPYTFLWSPVSGTKDSILSLCPGTYCCKVSDSTGCSDSVCATVPFLCGLYSASICYVTVDTLSQHNEIVWQRTGIDTTTVDSFIVYRGITSLVYQRIGAVSIHNHTTFVDTTCNPNLTSYDYKLGLSENCRIDSGLSAFHQTVFLQSNIALGNKVDLYWSMYVGATVNYYRILRDDSGNGNWHVLDSVPGTVNLYTDPTPPLNPGLRYLINTEWILNCTPFMIKHNKKSHFKFATNEESYSNTSLVVPSGIEPINPFSQVEIYPNPAGDVVFINAGLPWNGLITLTDVLGREIYSRRNSAQSGNKPVQLNIQSISSGVYFIKLEMESGQSIVKKIVKL